MSVTDSTQLPDDVVVSMTTSIHTPRVQAKVASNGRVYLSLGNLILALTPEAAASVAASLATAASTAILNATQQSVTRTLTVVPE